jgi:6,7-dimethyl-8-ribityllumazine synthase
VSHDSSPPDAHGLVVGVLVTRWYPEILARLLAGARATLEQAGVAAEDVLVREVPGAFELPLAADLMARGGVGGRQVDAIVALGCVVRGETPHFDHVARAAVDGLLKVSVDTHVPVGLGVITADTMAQAEARSAAVDGGVGSKGGNKGREAADAALRMALLARELEGDEA